MVRADCVFTTINDGSFSKDLYQFFAAYFDQDWDLEANAWLAQIAHRLRQRATELGAGNATQS